MGQAKVAQKKVSCREEALSNMWRNDKKYVDPHENNAH